MKKIIRAAIAAIMAIVIVLSLCACGAKENREDLPKADTRVADALNGGKNSTPDAHALCRLYSEGVWDGKFICDRQSINCASVEDGQLWINCKFALISDAEGAEPEASSFIVKTENGTWAKSDIGITLYDKGKIKKVIAVPFGIYGYTAVYFSKFIVAYDYESLLFVYDENGETIFASKEAIDASIVDDKLFVCTLDNNFIINSDGSVIEKASSDIACRAAQAGYTGNSPAKMDIDPSTMVEAYQAGNWDGKYRYFPMTDKYALVDYDGFVVVNNEKTTANINLPVHTSLKAGADWEKGKDGIFVIIGDNLCNYKNGDLLKEATIAENINGGEILYYTDDKVVIKVYTNDGFAVSIVDLESRISTIVQDHLLDARCAYDTIYTLDKEGNGYKIDWAKDQSKAEKVMEEVDLVSHHADEGEGFVIKNRFGFYGTIGKIYGPYCEPYSDPKN